AASRARTIPSTRHAARARLRTRRERSMTDTTPPLSGLEIGVAANATRALLDALLVETGTGFHHWVMLNFTGTAGGSVPRDAAVDRMVSALKIDTAEASAAVEEAITAGLVAADGDRLVLTPAGGARFEKIRAGTAAIVQRLYGDIPVDDQLTTRRVLATVTERANAELARVATAARAGVLGR